MELVIASIDRAGDHAAAVGVLALVGLIGGLIWGVIYLVGKGKARRRDTEA